MSGREAKWRRVLISGVAAAVAAALVIGGVQATRNSGPAPVAVVDSGGSSDRVTLAGTDPITGRKVDLADFRGKAVVINIWASWCPGCVAEAADLRRFAEVHPEAQVLGIDIQDTKAAARTFYAEWGWTWPSVFDPSGSISARFALQGLPTTLFLDREHRVVARIVGEGSFERFEAGLERAAAG